MVVEGEPQLQQQAPLQDAARDTRVPHCAEQDGVVAAQFLEDGVGQRLARCVPAAGTEVVLRRVDLDVVSDESRLEGAQCLARDLGTDAVAGDDCELDGGARLCHG